jgi:hypothetical protein
MDNCNNVNSTTGSFTNMPFGYCDCDKRCPKCGRLKLAPYPTITWNPTTCVPSYFGSHAINIR